MNFNRYDIHWVDLDPVRGSEMNKRRPCVIVSLDPLNRALKTVVICPVTSQLHSAWRSRLQIGINGKPSEIACDQIRTVSKERVGKKLHSLSTTEASMLRKLLSEMYGEP